MLIFIAKILSAVFAALVISKSVLSFKQGRESWVMTAFWSLTWVGIAVISFFPDLINRALGEERIGVGTLLGIGLTFLYFVIYRIYVKADRIEKQLQRLIREHSLRDLGRGKK